MKDSLPSNFTTAIQSKIRFPLEWQLKKTPGCFEIVSGHSKASSERKIMNLYEDDNYIDQLANESIEEDLRRKQAIDFTHQAIDTIPSGQLKIVLRMMMSIITKNY
jgi:hypothetical protein